MEKNAKKIKPFTLEKIQIFTFKYLLYLLKQDYRNIRFLSYTIEGFLTHIIVNYISVNPPCILSIFKLPLLG